MLSKNENNAWVEKRAARSDEEANLREERDKQEPQKQRYRAGFSEHAYFFNVTLCLQRHREGGKVCLFLQ